MSLRTHRRLKVSLVFVAALLTAAVIGAWWLSLRTPRWWLDLNAKDPALHAAAESVENGVTTLLSSARDTAPGQRASLPWHMTLDDRSASAWLTSRLPAWVEHRLGDRAWPSGLSQVQVVFEDGMIIVGARYSGAGDARFVSISFTPMVDAQGRLWLKGAGARVGELPAPLSTALAPLDRSASASLRSLGAALRGREPLPDLVIPLADARRVRITGVSVAHGSLKLECSTILRER